MGRRSIAKTVSQTLLAFMQQRTWQQSALAESVGVSVRTLRRVMKELVDGGVPFEREEETPQVYWSVPRWWLPGGAALEMDQVRRVARLIGRLPSSQDRELLLAFLKALLAGKPTEASPGENPGTDVLSALEDGQERRQSVRMRYESASRAAVEDRYVSVHQVEYGPTTRFVATCHRKGELKWFRVDNVRAATLDPTEKFRGVEPGVLDEFVATSVDGYHGSERADTYTCRVAMPEARWIVRNLPDGLKGEVTGDAGRITARTTALDVFARFVVGHGGAVQAESPELRARVRELAERALVVHTDGPRG